MNIVTTTSVFPIGSDQFHVLERLANIGYTSLDMAFDYCDTQGSPFLSPKYEDWAKGIKDRADRLGVQYSHSHASFDASARGDIVRRNFHSAQIMGIRYMVVHPIFQSPDGHIYENAEEFLSVNQKAYEPLISEASEYGLILLSENLLWGASIFPALLSELVDRIGSPHFGWCFDTGHAHHGGLPQTSLIGLKHSPLSLHVQDNHGQHDEHLLPGDGSIDWKEFLHTLRAIGYGGDFVLEAHHQSIDAPDEKRDIILSELMSRAKQMVSYFNRI